MPRRSRLSHSPVGEILTFSTDLALHEYDAPILEHALNKYQFPHWAEHFYSSSVFHGTDTPDYLAHEKFAPVQAAVVAGLNNAQYVKEAAEVASCSTETEMNEIIIKQYTDEVGLYESANTILRDYHSSQIVAEHDLAPWMLQLNCAIRRQKEFKGVAYRGTDLSTSDLEKYQERVLFVWAPFTSASKTIDSCLGGNAIFEITPRGAMSLHDKRYARDISPLSIFPDEEEVIFPICCAYRVVEILDHTDYHLIKLDTIDWN